MDSSQTRISSFARPMRIAFLVELEEASHPILDAIFSFAFSIWAGRFSLVVPCANGVALPEFLPWLRSFDPDVIYSYVDLTPTLQDEFHEEFYPSFLLHHPRPQLAADALAYRPALPVQPLSVVTLLPIASNRAGIRAARGTRVISAMGNLERDRFLTDNFGIAEMALRTSIASVLSDYAATTLAIEPGAFEPRQRYLLANEQVLSSTNELLGAMAINAQLMGVAQLSAIAAPRLEINEHVWRSSFNIVVGDTVDDRLLYWNARAHQAPWLDGSDVDLCVPRAKFDDEAFVTALRSYINRRNLNNTQNGPHRATLRSVSLNDVELARLSEKLGTRESFVSYNHAHVPSVNACIPTEEALGRRILVVGLHGFRAPNLWNETYATGPELHVNPPNPEHLRHMATSHLSPRLGAWAVDLDIERSVSHQPGIPPGQRWRLPRRLRMAERFCDDLVFDRRFGLTIPARATFDGLLTLYSVTDSQWPAIKVPTDHQAVLYGLERGRNWMPFTRGQQRAPIPLCFEAARSSAGRQFWGVYQLFGGLNAACAVLMHTYWRKQLEEFGATDQRADARRAKINAQLARRIRPSQFDLANENQRNTLSDIVLQAADEERMTTPVRKWTDFERDFMAMAAEYDQRYPRQGPSWSADEELRYRQATLREYVQHLCRLNVLHQGYEHKCPRCHHRGWVAIADLRANIVCEVCHDAHPAPVDRPWQFRLNGFLREALQRHGIGPLFWVLNRFRHPIRRSWFWFDGPLDIYLDQAAADSRQRTTDIDLTIIESGLVRMCEVKQSERQFNDPLGFAEVMKKLRPDIATVAVMETETPLLREKFNAFADHLANTGVRAELLTLNEANDFEDGPYFTAG